MFFLFDCCLEPEEEIVENVKVIDPLEGLRPNAPNQILIQAAQELAVFAQENPNMQFAADLQRAIQRGSYVDICEQFAVAQDYAQQTSQLNRLSRLASAGNTNVEFLNIFQSLAQSGCWDTLLACIVSGYCNPLQHNIISLYAKTTGTETETSLLEQWKKLIEAPRSDVRDIDGNVRENLYKVVSNNSCIELSFMYLAFRFLQAEHIFVDKDNGSLMSTKNKLFYKNCINHLLQDCVSRNRLQPTLLALLCLAHIDIIKILTPETKTKLREQMVEHCPAGEIFICGSEGKKENVVVNDGEVLATEHTSVVVRPL